MISQKSARQQYQNTVNNAQGQALESYIKAACVIYKYYINQSNNITYRWLYYERRKQ